MNKQQKGFSVIEGLLLVVVVIALVGISYTIYNRRQTNTSTTNKTQATITADGTSESIDEMTAQDSSSEAAIDSKYSDNEASTAQSSNTAASNIGGAYNESSL